MISVLLLTLTGCPPRQITPPPRPLQETIIKARELFAMGDWDALSEHLPKLPGEGRGAEEARFYQALLIGFKYPKRGLKHLERISLERSHPHHMYLSFYKLIFQAQLKKCILVEGALRGVYLPKPDLNRGAKTLLEEALKFCEAQKLPKVQSQPKPERATPPARPTFENRSQGKDLPVTADQTGGSSPRVRRAAKVSPRSLSPIERRQSTPSVHIWTTAESPLKLAFKQMSKLFTAQRAADRESVDLKVHTLIPDDAEHITRLASQLDSSDLLIIDPQTPELREAALKASAQHNAARLIFTPKLDASLMQPKANPPTWHFFVTTRTIVSSIAEALKNRGATKVGVFYPDNERGERLRDFIRAELSEGPLSVKHSQALSEDTDWEATAERAQAWPVDSLIFVDLDSSKVGMMIGHLNKRGVRSRSRRTGEDPNARHIALWPTLYDDALLQQTGRALEGALIVTPVARTTEPFYNLNTQTQERFDRPATWLDALIFDLIQVIDGGIRLSDARELPLREALERAGVTATLTLSFDFSRPQIIQSLTELEIRDQEFVSAEGDAE